MDSQPLLVTRLGASDQSCRALERAPFTVKSKDETELKYKELSLQSLLHEHPAILPIGQIEPAFMGAVPVCMELKLPSGDADNLLLTPNGGIVLVEAKLWRNPESRREVVGQILDYAKDFTRLTYDDLERLVRKARKAPDARLADLVLGEEAGTEAETRFVDRLSRNLRLGRILLLIVGDGIQEGVEELTDFVQRHLGLHFTLGLVELTLWPLPDSEDVLVYPRVLTRTVQIERAVIRLPEGAALAPPQVDAISAKASRPTTLTEQEYFEALAAVNPALPERLRSFRQELNDIGIETDIQRSLVMRWRSPDGRPFSLGVIAADGTLATDYCNTSADAIGRVDLSHAFQAELAALVPGASIRQTPNPAAWRAVLGNKNLPVTPLLDRKAEWIAAIERYIAALRQAIGA